jgi:hypothetical protein
MPVMPAANLNQWSAALSTSSGRWAEGFLDAFVLFFCQLSGLLFLASQQRLLS